MPKQPLTKTEELMTADAILDYAIREVFRRGPKTESDRAAFDVVRKKMVPRLNPERVAAIKRLTGIDFLAR